MKNPQIIATLAAALWMLISSAHGQSTEEVMFDCSSIPSVCTNMCWGIYCTFGDNNAEATLTYDAPSDATKDSRRTKARCLPNPNRCSGNPSDSNSCDEYPFASTEDADNVQQVTRCVPQSENSSQGGTLSQFYPVLQAPEQFIVGIGNPGAAGVNYCTVGDACDNDGTINQGGDVAPNPPNNAAVRQKHFYVMESGMTFLSTRDSPAGTKIRYLLPMNETIAARAKELSSDPKLLEGVAWRWETISHKIDG